MTSPVYRTTRKITHPLGRISKLIDSGESANAELCRVYKRLDEIFPPFWLVARAPLFSRKSAPKFVPGGVLPCVLPGYKYTETPGRITHSTSHHSSYRSGGYRARIEFYTIPAKEKPYDIDTTSVFDDRCTFYTSKLEKYGDARAKRVRHGIPVLVYQKTRV